VSYRAKVSTIARTFGLTGFVQNFEDDRVTREYADFYDLVGGGKTDYMMDKAAEYLLKLISVMAAGFGTLKAETAESIK